MNFFVLTKHIPHSELHNMLRKMDSKETLAVVL